MRYVTLLYAHFFFMKKLIIFFIIIFSKIWKSKFGIFHENPKLCQNMLSSKMAEALRQSRCPCTAPWFHSNFSRAELNIIFMLCQKLQNARPLYSLVRTSARLRSYFLRRSLRSFFACDRESDFSE